MQERLRRRQVRKRAGKKDSEARRIGELFNSAARKKDRSNPLADFVGNKVPKGNSFNNPAAWDTFARGALRLDSADLETEAIRRAFEKFKLDPIDPFSWRQIVSYFAFIFFVEYPNKKAGAPQTPREKLDGLLAELTQLKIQNPNIFDRDAALLLAKKKGIGHEGLRKQLRKAKRTKSP